MKVIDIIQERMFDRRVMYEENALSEKDLVKKERFEAIASELKYLDGVIDLWRLGLNEPKKIESEPKTVEN